MPKRRTVKAAERKARKGKKSGGQSKYAQKGGPHLYGELKRVPHPHAARRKSQPPR